MKTFPRARSLLLAGNLLFVLSNACLLLVRLGQADLSQSSLLLSALQLVTVAVCAFTAGVIVAGDF